ncbi:SPASM domain-containing protein [Undibacterium sp. Di26W]|uniref:SPASM domain-containing protein n=1 Tax=Undibacterium sp. Di26W TaxID=3413035 RepID=UPI003BEFA7E5
MQLKESTYNIRVPLLGGKSLLFNSLSQSLCLLEGDELDSLGNLGSLPSPLASGQQQLLFDQLGSQGFVLPDSVNELNVVKKMYDASRYDSGTVTLTVCPTLACNFGCDYCFQGADKPVQTMSEEVQDGVVQLYHRLLEHVPELHTLRSMWYGGEPLLRPTVIYSLADRLIDINKNRGINYTAAMISNGSKMNRAVAQQLYAHGLRTVQITLDGAREDHDSRRYYLSKKGSYDKIIANMKEWIYEIPIKIDLRVNIDERNKGGVLALIDDLAAEGLANLPNLKMYFAPVESITTGCHAIADKMIQKLQYGKLESELLRYAFDKGLSELPYVPSFMGICSALKPNDYIVVPNGDVHKCWDTVSFPNKRIGTIFDLDALFANKSPAQKKWEQFNPFDNATCSSCKILPNCSSFCAHKFVNAADTLGEASLPCPSLKYSINEKIVLRAEKEGFITRNDYTPEMIRTNPLSLCSEVFVKEDYLSEDYLKEVYLTESYMSEVDLKSDLKINHLDDAFTNKNFLKEEKLVYVKFASRS